VGAANNSIMSLAVIHYIRSSVIYHRLPFSYAPPTRTWKTCRNE